MKKLWYVALVLLLAAPAGLVAQQRMIAQAEIPFAFTAHEQEFAAGSYQLWRAGAQTIRFVPAHSQQGLTLLSPQPVVTAPEITIRFVRFGNRYYLTAVENRAFAAKLQQTYVETRIQARAEEIAIVVRAGQ